MDMAYGCIWEKKAHSQKNAGYSWFRIPPFGLYLKFLVIQGPIPWSDQPPFGGLPNWRYNVARPHMCHQDT